MLASSVIEVAIASEALEPNSAKRPAYGVRFGLIAVACGCDGPAQVKNLGAAPPQDSFEPKVCYLRMRRIGVKGRLEVSR